MSTIIELIEMDSSRRAEFLAGQAVTYAESLFRSGSFASLAEAEERAHLQLKSILALETEEQFFFCMRAASPGNLPRSPSNPASEEVGVLWWTLRMPARSVSIYDIAVFEQFRRKGFARAALQALEKWCRDHSCSQIGLNVFAFNTGAEKLYREMGFEDTSKQMRKLLL